MLLMLYLVLEVTETYYVRNKSADFFYRYVLVSLL